MDSDCRVTRQDAFLLAFRQIKMIIECGERLTEKIIDNHGSIDPAVLAGLDADLARIVQLGSVMPLVTRLKDKRVQRSVIPKLNHAIEEAKSLIDDPAKRASDTIDHLALSLFDVMCELELYCETLAISVFGHWGAYWFQIAQEGLPTEDVFGSTECHRDVPVDVIITLLSQPEPHETDRARQMIQDEANRWIYEQLMAGEKHGKIASELKHKPVGWPRISSPAGLKARGAKYATEHGLPLPGPRPPGRPPGS